MFESGSSIIRVRTVDIESYVGNAVTRDIELLLEIIDTVSIDVRVAGILLVPVNIPCARGC